jgi:hypothetical protein
MRGALAVPLLAMALILTGCEGSAASLKPNGADERDGRVAMAFEEYAFRPELPKDAFVCAAMSDTHPHGFFFRVGARYADCDAARDAAVNDRWVAVWAKYNAAEYPSLAETGCRKVEAGEEALEVVIRRWDRQGVAAARCDEAGASQIRVSAMSAKEDGGLSRFTYDFSMASDDAHFDDDLKRFVAMLDSVRFNDPQ